VLEEDRKKLRDKFDLILDIKKISNLKSQISNLFKKISDTKYKIQNDYFHIKPYYSNNFSAYVPIMTGCNNFCSYCVVPYTRGREVSRPPKEIISEVKELVKRGYKEIILLGQNVNSYNSQFPNSKIQIPNKFQIQKAKNKSDFVNLLEKINEIPGNFWLRFITSHPKDMSNELIRAMSRLDKLTEYVHLPVQSGDDEVLKRMNRNYTVKHYLGLIEKIRKVRSEIAISTDIIVGFPGETKKQFNNTAKLMRQVGFDMAYIACYSPRSGTAAARLINNVPQEEKEKRRKILTKILEKSALKNNKKLIGKVVEVLVDTVVEDKIPLTPFNKGERGNFVCYGKTRMFKTVKFIGNKNLLGQFVKVKIKKVGAYGLEGEIVSSN